MGPNAAGGVWVAGSQPMSTAVHRSPNKLNGDLTPYLTYVVYVAEMDLAYTYIIHSAYTQCKLKSIPLSLSISWISFDFLAQDWDIKPPLSLLLDWILEKLLLTNIKESYMIKEYKKLHSLLKILCSAYTQYTQNSCTSVNTDPIKYFFLQNLNV